MASTYILKSAPSREDLTELSRRYPALDIGAAQTYLALLGVAGEILSMSSRQMALRKSSPGKLTILIYLQIHSAEGTSPCELADAVKVSRATITGLVDGLERSGLIERRATPGDRRSVKIKLTAAGRKFLDSVMPERCRRISALMADLSEKERKTLRELLEKIAQSKAFKEFVKTQKI
jgi:DNA-binding MarR family transcriptional regulator